MRKAILAPVLALGVALLPARLGVERRPPPPAPPPPKPEAVVIPLPGPPPRRRWHPEHRVKVWMAKFHGRIFRTVQLPRCEHIEMVITYVPAPGETCVQAKRRTGAIVACSGSYHHPQSMALADFLSRSGHVLAGRRTQRGILTSDPPQVADILDHVVRGKQVDAVALGSRLVPFSLDGFPRSFANEQTDRMAIGLTKGYVFVVQGKSDLWRLSAFMREALGCSKAINADGGHVVKGRGPVHIAFRWRRR